MPKITVVVVAAIRQRGKYLLTKRHDPKFKVVHNRWQMPGGGLEFGETIKDCIKREIMEETGVAIKNLRLLPYIYESTHQFKGWHGVVLTFLCQPQEENPTIRLNEEAREFGWFAMNEIKKLRLHFGTFDVLKKIEETLL